MYTELILEYHGSFGIDISMKFMSTRLMFNIEIQIAKRDTQKVLEHHKS